MVCSLKSVCKTLLVIVLLWLIAILPVYFSVTPTLHGTYITVFNIIPSRNEGDKQTLPTFYIHDFADYLLVVYVYLQIFHTLLRRLIQKMRPILQLLQVHNDVSWAILSLKSIE